MVPPRPSPAPLCTVSPPQFHSVISPITGSSQGPNSVEPAAAIPATLRAVSITASCIPKQMPK